MTVNGKELNIGDLLHVGQIAVLVVALVAGWVRMQMAAEQQAKDSRKLDRIVLYLASHDPEYWKYQPNEQ